MSRVHIRQPDTSTDQNVYQHESEVRSYCRNFDATFTRAEGSYLFTEDGRRYLDFLAGCSALNYGHNDPDLANSLVEYVKGNGLALGLDLHTSAKSRFIEVFTSLILQPRNLPYKLQFTGPTGTNAVEAAIKLARKVTGRSQIVAFTRGFHGVTEGALAATANSHHRMAQSQHLPNVTRAYYDGYFGPNTDTARFLEESFHDPSSGFDLPAAILVETVQGEGGLNVAGSEWFKKIAKVAKKHGALLIVDDIQAGCGRTGSFFSFEPLGVKPDIVTLSKSLSGMGLPMSLVLLKPEIDQWLPGEHNGTFRGNSLAFVTATAALEKYWSCNSLMNDVKRRGDLVRQSLTEIAKTYPSFAVKGRGMFLGLDVGDGERASAISQKCFENGLIIETAGPHGEVLKILAPLTTADELLSQGLETLQLMVEKEMPNPVVLS